jgi:hypothetical protein
MVRAWLPWTELGQRLLPLVDRVYTAVHTGNIPTTGHHVVVYRGADARDLALEVGIEVAEPFEHVRDLVCSQTPGGEGHDRALGSFLTRPRGAPGGDATEPVLVVVLHGDAPFHTPDDQHTFAATGEATHRDVVAVGLLPPGNTDPQGNASDGVRGLTTGDNWNAMNTDAIAHAIGELKRRYHAIIQTRRTFHVDLPLDVR